MKRIDENGVLFLNDSDFYRGNSGLEYLRGGDRILHEASLVFRMNKDGEYSILKDRYGLDKDEVESKIGLIPDRRLLLMM